MKSYCRFVLLLFLLFCATTAFPQLTLSGKITNVEGKPLPNVNVMIRESGHEKIYHFTSSDKDGVYTLIFNEDEKDKRIVFRILGYDEKTFNLSGVSFPLNVILTETNNVLNEIVIKPQAIRVKKDTTEYMVSSFSDGTEGAIEDVLRKMPGIEVSDNGDISFKGKSIEKIMLDDTDLFDKNYKLASKNVPAKFIDKVQAIENYHENRLLKHAENSDKIILNLSLREDINTQKPIGTIATAGGYENKYALQTNLLSMNKKLKLYDILDLNNSELSSPFSLEDNANTLYEEFDSYADAEVVNGYFDRVSNEGIKRAETKQEFNSLNWVYQPVKKLQLTGNLLFNKNRETFTDHERIFYYSDSLLIDNTSSIKKEPQTVYGSLKLKYDLKENMTLLYQGKYNADKKPMRNTLFIPDAYLYNTLGENKFMTHNLDLTMALKDSSALVFNTSAFSNWNLQQFDYYNMEDSTTEIDQRMKATTFQYNASVKYYNKNRNHFSYTLQAVFSLNDQDVNNTASLEDASALINVDMTYKSGKSAFSFTSGMGYRNQTLSSPEQQPHTDKRFEFSPHLSYQLSLGNHGISLFGSYAQGKFSLLDYINYFTDYRGSRTGSNVYEYGSSISYGATYFYFKPQNQTFFLLSYIRSINKNMYANKTEITPVMNYSSLIPGQNRENQLLIINFKKYIDELRHGVNWENSLNYMEYSNAVNSDVLRKNKGLSTNSRFSIKSVFDWPVNYNLGVRFRYSAYKTDLLPQIHTINYTLFQELLYRPNRQWRIKLYFDEYFLGKDKRFYLFIRPDITYSFKKYKLSIGINTYNILNNNQIADYQISDYYSIENDYSIVSGQYLLNIQFQF
ncbi:hypothetical protein FACS189432_02160 [Bacteroidia bacterium]|nr:hypothetical protein FACS189426_20510 [Bacteroidia bacterium]GHT26873.1 hypothetical protein FACS189432_02160 [Bacteroidia bacterium]